METVNTKHTMRSRVTTFGIGMALVVAYCIGEAVGITCEFN